MKRIWKTVSEKSEYIFFICSMIILSSLLYRTQTAKNKVLYLVCMALDVSSIVPKCLEDLGVNRGAEIARQIDKIFKCIVVILGVVFVVGSAVGL